MSTFKACMDALRIEVSQREDRPENRPFTLPACPKCGAMPEILLGRRSGMHMALHKVGCKRTTVYAATREEVVKFWEEQ